MFLDSALRYTNYLCKRFSCYTWVVFYKLENSIYGLISIFLTTFLTTFLTNFLTTRVSNVIRNGINTFYSINIKFWQSKDKTIPRGRKLRLHPFDVAIMSFEALKPTELIQKVRLPLTNINF